ncbi:hypothetical protein ACOMHN_062892 [Nucella lapillus]
MVSQQLLRHKLSASASDPQGNYVVTRRGRSNTDSSSNSRGAPTMLNAVLTSAPVVKTNCLHVTPYVHIPAYRGQLSNTPHLHAVQTLTVRKTRRQACYLHRTVVIVCGVWTVVWVWISGNL